MARSANRDRFQTAIPDGVALNTTTMASSSVWFVYILRCSDDSLYIGETNDVAARVTRHNDGRASSFTACRRPVQLVFTEAYPARDGALVRERQLK